MPSVGNKVYIEGKGVNLSYKNTEIISMKNPNNEIKLDFLILCLYLTKTKAQIEPTIISHALVTIKKNLVLDGKKMHIEQ